MLYHGYNASLPSLSTENVSYIQVSKSLMPLTCSAIQSTSECRPQYRRGEVLRPNCVTLSTYRLIEPSSSTIVTTWSICHSGAAGMFPNARATSDLKATSLISGRSRRVLSTARASPCSGSRMIWLSDQSIMELSEYSPAK